MMCRSGRRVALGGLSLALAIGGCSSSTKRDQHYPGDAGTSYAIPDGGFLLDMKAAVPSVVGSTQDVGASDTSPRADAGDVGAVSRADSD